MAPYNKLSKEKLKNLKSDLEKQFEEIKKKGLKLDMSRGKPSKAQLDLGLGMMDVLASDSDLVSSDGMDCRNYGVLDGISDARKLLADLSEVPERSVIIYGNSSLNVMFDTVSRAMTHGFMGSTPWAKDPSIKGIWCVPKYSNPTGISYSDETVRRFARLQPAAKDFRIFWDNAYSIHHLYDDKRVVVLELLNECIKVGNPDIVLKFISTSKVSFPGSGIAALAASRGNLEDARRYMKFQTIGHDKLNQLRHVRFFGDMLGVYEHMRKHAAILRPKFEKVEEVLEKELGGLGIGTWTEPLGGYFISFDSMEGCAKAIVAKAKEAGLVMTDAGATYPYGKDPRDCNIRIAPSFPTVDELEVAAKIFVLSVKLVSIEKLLDA